MLTLKLLVRYDNPSSATVNQRPRYNPRSNALFPRTPRTTKMAAIESPLFLADQDDSICRACSQIDFRKVLHMDGKALSKWFRNKRLIIATIDGYNISTMSSSCALCRFWLEALGSDFSPNETFELRAFQFLTNALRCITIPPHGIWRDHDQPTLAIVPSKSSTVDKLEFYRDQSDRFGDIACRFPTDQPNHIFIP